MYSNQSVPLSEKSKQSLKEWTIDYLGIIVMLVLITVGFSIIYLLMGRVREVTEIQSNLLICLPVAYQLSLYSVTRISTAVAMV